MIWIVYACKKKSQFFCTFSLPLLEFFDCSFRSDELNQPLEPNYSLKRKSIILLRKYILIWLEDFEAQFRNTAQNWCKWTQIVVIYCSKISVKLHAKRKTAKAWDRLAEFRVLRKFSADIFFQFAFDVFYWLFHYRS